MKFKFDIKSSLIFGILFYILGLILGATGIFSMIANLEYIGLFLGVLIGGFGGLE